MISSLPPPVPPPQHDPASSPGPDPYRAPKSRDVKPSPPDSQGSVGLGILYFFLALIAGSLLTGLVSWLLAWVSQLQNGFASVLQIFSFGVLPPLVAPLFLGLWLQRKGQYKTAKGVWLGYAVFVGLLVLLVAACFGILLSGGLGNMH